MRAYLGCGHDGCSVRIGGRGQWAGDLACRLALPKKVLCYGRLIGNVSKRASGSLHSRDAADGECHSADRCRRDGWEGASSEVCWKSSAIRGADGGVSVVVIVDVVGEMLLLTGRGRKTAGESNYYY